MELASLTLTSTDLGLIFGVGGAILALLIALFHEQRNCNKTTADNAVEIGKLTGVMEAMQQLFTDLKQMFGSVQEACRRRMDASEKRLNGLEKRMASAEKRLDQIEKEEEAKK